MCEHEFGNSGPIFSHFLHFYSPLDRYLVRTISSTFIASFLMTLSCVTTTTAIKFLTVMIVVSLILWVVISLILLFMFWHFRESVDGFIFFSVTSPQILLVWIYLLNFLCILKIHLTINSAVGKSTFSVRCFL